VLIGGGERILPQSRIGILKADHAGVDFLGTFRPGTDEGELGDEEGAGEHQEHRQRVTGSRDPSWLGAAMAEVIGVDHSQSRSGARPATSCGSHDWFWRSRSLNRWVVPLTFLKARTTVEWPGRRF
jgi:hypothetical protein